MTNPEVKIVINLQTKFTMEEAVTKMLGWVQGRMQRKSISILTPESSTKNSLEPQALPPVGIEPDMDKKHQQKKQPKWRQQEKAILAAITSLGHDPQSLPKIEAGIPGVKAAVKESL